MTITRTCKHHNIEYALTDTCFMCDESRLFTRRDWAVIIGIAVVIGVGFVKAFMGGL